MTIFKLQKKPTSKALMRVIFLIGFMICFAAAPLKAGTIAKIKIYGFSPDGTYFVFEEYGVQDGSGFPFSNVYVVDTTINKWVKGSPIRTLIKDENATLKQARIKSIEQAVEQYEWLVNYRPGAHLAHNPITEANRNPHRIRVLPYPNPYAAKDARTYRLEEKRIPTRRCATYGPGYDMGFNLYVKMKDRPRKLLWADQRIPTSRRCPRAYALHDVLRYSPKSNPNKELYVVIIQVLSFGFEGDDGRFISSSYWFDK